MASEWDHRSAFGNPARRSNRMITEWTVDRYRLECVRLAAGDKALADMHQVYLDKVMDTSRWLYHEITGATWTEMSPRVRETTRPGTYDANDQPTDAP